MAHVTTTIFDPSFATRLDLVAQLGGDEKLNAEPIKSTIYDVDAGTWNQLVAGMSEVGFQMKYGFTTSQMFSIDDALAGQTDAQIPVNSGGDTALERIVMPNAGVVVGVSAWVESLQSAGSLTVNWSLNSSNAGNLPVVIDSTNKQRIYAQQAQSTAGGVFAAGDEIGIMYTTDAGWLTVSPTPSLMVVLWMVFTG